MIALSSKDIIRVLQRYEDKLAKITLILLSLQLLHLTWLSVDVIGQQHVFENPILKFGIIVIDYIEIPGLITGLILFGIDSTVRKNKWSIISFILLASQPIHLFWVSDEMIGHLLTGAAFVGMPLPLAYLSIAIDFFELPVIAVAMKKTIKKPKPMLY